MLVHHSERSCVSPNRARFKNGLFQLLRVYLLGLCTAVSLVHSVAHAEIPTGRVIPTKELIELAREADGEDRFEIELLLLERYDLSGEERDEVIADMLARYEGKNFQPGIGLARLYEGILLMQAGKYRDASQSLALAQQAGEYCKDEWPKIYFESIVQVARIHFEQGEFERSIALAKQSLAFGKKFGTALRLTRPLRLLSLCSSPLGLHEDSRNYLVKEYEFALEQENELASLAAIEAIARQLILNGEFDEAVQWIELAETKLATIPNQRLEIFFASLRSLISLERGELAEAAQGFRRLAKRNLEPLRIDERVAIFEGLARTERRLGNPEEALRLFILTRDKFALQLRAKIILTLDACLCLIDLDRSEEAVQILHELSKGTAEDLQQDERRLAILSEAYEQLGDIENAFKALRQCQAVSQKNSFATMTDQVAKANAAIKNREKDRKLFEAQQAAIKSKYAAEKEKTQAEMVSAALKLADEQAENARWLRNSSIAASVMTFGFLTLILRARSRKQLHEQEVRLNEILREKLETREAELETAANERRQLELAFEEQRREKAISQLIGGIAHDFNNLLTVMLQSNRLLERTEPSLSERSRDFLDAANQAGETGADIVRQLLAIIRKTKVDPQAFSLSSWLASSQRLFHSTLGETITLTIDDQSKGTMIYADPAQLSTAVINLLSNSRDAITHNGKVDISLTLLDKLSNPAATSNPIDYVEADETAKRWVRIQVTDNGCGMSAEQLEHACDPFFTSKGFDAGTGLGLTTASAFMKQLGGSINFDSELHSGTTVTMEIPCLQLSSTQGDSPKQLASRRFQRSTHAAWDFTPPESRPRTVLVVDDQPGVRESTARLLTAMGYEVKTADNGDSAYRQIKSEGCPEFVVTDIRMPGEIDGLGLYERILQLGCETRVILVTGYCDTLPLGLNNVLMKPFTAEQLQDALSETPRVLA